MSQQWGHDHSLWANDALDKVGRGEMSKEAFLMEVATLPDVNPYGGCTKDEWLDAMDEMADKVIDAYKGWNNG